MNCLGNEVESGCVRYSGPDIPQLGIVSGDPLDTVIQKIAAYQVPPVTAPPLPTTDNIVTKAAVRSTGSLCASSIIKRDFTYSLSVNTAGTTLTYNLVDVVSNLPSGYELAVARVTASGKPMSGLSGFFDSRSLATSLSIPLQRYPVVIEFLLRITSPCGQIDMKYTLNLINPTTSGNFRAVLEANDLNPTSGEILLTTQLNNLESKVQKIEGQIQDALVGNTTLAQQDLTLSEVQAKVDNPDSFSVTYVKDGGTNTGELKNLVSDLYAEIRALKDKTAAQQLELTNVKTQLNAL